MLFLSFPDDLSRKDVPSNNPYQTGNPQYQTQTPGPAVAPDHVNVYMPMAPTTQVAPMIHFGRIPTQCVCPRCRLNIVTRIEHKTGMLMWLLCIGLFVFGFVLGCCLIPFCIDSLGDVQHYCPHCAALVGEHRSLWTYLCSLPYARSVKPLFSFQIYVFIKGTPKRSK